MGTLSYKLALSKSKLHVEQMDCVIFSENGIVLTTASDYEDQERDLDADMIHKYLKKLRSAKNYGVSDYEFYKIL